jgi:type I restriction enzyme R subunit
LDDRSRASHRWSIREEVYFTKGRVIVRGNTVQRGEAKKADYLLYYKPNFLLAEKPTGDTQFFANYRDG